MQAVIFCGIQASGKTTFYRERFFETHVRINLDMLRTRHREQLLLKACLEGRQPFVVDNTNLTVADRARYLPPARAAGFEVICYFFRTEPRAAHERNRRRQGRAAVPAAALFGAQKRLEVPTLEEGLHKLFSVEISDDGAFLVETLTAAPRLT